MIRTVWGRWGPPVLVGGGALIGAGAARMAGVEPWASAAALALAAWSTAWTWAFLRWRRGWFLAAAVLGAASAAGPMVGQELALASVAASGAAAGLVTAGLFAAWRLHVLGLEDPSRDEPAARVLVTRAALQGLVAALLAVVLLLLPGAASGAVSARWRASLEVTGPGPAGFLVLAYLAVVTGLILVRFGAPPRPASEAPMDPATTTGTDGTPPNQGEPRRSAQA